MMLKNAVVGQSGGPTCAINATLAGVIDSLLKSKKIDKVYGMINGIDGILNENLKELNKIFSDKDNLSLLKLTPSSYLGSCRVKLPEENEDKKMYEKIFSTLEKFNIEYFFYIGGNDSMDTVMKLNNFAKSHNKKLTVIGVPKTIDNDLWGTDHCPGFASAAKYVATSIAEIARDAYCYDIESVTIVEIMGRNAGWLAASSALARSNNQSAPDLIYLPEHPFEIENFYKDIEEKFKTKKNLIIAVSEGIKDSNGLYIAASNQIYKNDKFGHMKLGGAAKNLENAVKIKFGCKCRSVELNVLQRCASHFLSKTDISESFKIGKTAVSYAFKGVSGEMMIFKREKSDEYKMSISSMDINLIANKEKQMPKNFINANGNDVTKAFINYARPLILGEEKILTKDGIPVHISLK
ncbi:MAG: 6-phosphofructokinase [Ruminococcaceae bacterium]|nr:6-phosphofructokinase [Oscillospiraceae bacterium]